MHLLIVIDEEHTAVTLPPRSSIALLIFSTTPRLNYAKLVGELNAKLARRGAGPRSVRWDSDEIALFDLHGAQILLGFIEHPGSGHAACLSVAFGPGPHDATSAPLAQRHARLCRLIVGYLQSRYLPDAILWHQATDAVTPAMIEDLAAALPRIEALRPPHQPHAQAQAPDVLPTTVMAKIRATLFPEEEMVEFTKPSTQLRLAAHSMNATLVMVSLPVGAALMTYALLRGEDMRMSSRMMALSGTLLGLSHSPIGHRVMALF
ncbi:MAG: hypothetical protein WCC57_19480 [Paracoccaceae bacterium]